MDVTRNFCEKIIHSDNIENSLASAIKNILFEIGDKETQILQMERYGFMRDNAFCFLCISSKEDNNSAHEEKYKRLSRYAEKVGRSIRDLFIHFVYKETLILVLVEYSEEEVNRFLDDFMYNIKNANVTTDIYVGVSSIISGISDQRNNFENAINTNKIAVRNNSSIVRYDRLGLTKIFMDVKDKNLLYDYYYTIIGKIEQYDKENGTELLDFLKTYISCNGSPRLVSEKQYIHRNTVNNMIKKIERITGYNLLNLEAKVISSIGFMIKDVL
ncbi:MAG: PucR family transcriptional regulator [Clostridiales bacterium]|nr:PucR family transcriptional regulator [Clostridiales bacterium]